MAVPVLIYMKLKEFLNGDNVSEMENCQFRKNQLSISKMGMRVVKGMGMGMGICSSASLSVISRRLITLKLIIGFLYG